MHFHKTHINTLAVKESCKKIFFKFWSCIIATEAQIFDYSTHKLIKSEEQIPNQIFL